MLSSVTAVTNQFYGTHKCETADINLDFGIENNSNLEEKTSPKT